MSITVDTLRSIRVEMLEAQRTAYEQQIARMEDIHAQQLRQMREDYDRSDDYKTRMIRYLSIALAVLIVLVISVLVVDLLNRDVGWFRTMFDESKMSNSRLSGIVDFARRIFGGAV